MHLLRFFAKVHTHTLSKDSRVCPMIVVILYQKVHSPNYIDRYDIRPRPQRDDRGLGESRGVLEEISHFVVRSSVFILRICSTAIPLRKIIFQLRK